MKQNRSENEKIQQGTSQQEDELEALLNNPKSQIKSIKQLENQLTPTPKALGKYIAQGKEKLRDLRVTNYFADRAIEGGLT